MIYRLPGCAVGARELAERLDDDASADVVLFREDGVAVGAAGGRELRFAPENGGWRSRGGR